MNGAPAIRRRRSSASVLLEFLGSMNLAITLLVAVSIASVIGTVLQQNQPYQDYVMKFGPFWFEVFEALKLYDVYGAGWFLALLGFLLVSTAVCVVRQAPGILRDMRQFRLDVQEKSLRHFRLLREWQSDAEPAASAERAEQVLAAAGFRTRQKAHDDHIQLAAMRGGAGRLGYLFTHVAIVVICVGGLIDGNVPVKLALATGELKPETRDISASEVPAESTLPADNASFRATVSIAEGGSANVAFTRAGPGYLVQELPFSVAVDDFRIEHYSTGMPKSFESDLVVFDRDGNERLRRTIAVNHPLVYEGYNIYQASFSDGGSKLKVKAWSFDLPSDPPLELDGAVNRELALNTPSGPRTVEFTDFKAFNIFPVEEGDTDAAGQKHRNFGPSMVFKVRKPNGEATEYVNYMLPIQQEGRGFLLTGVRNTPAEDYRYLRIPVDAEGGAGRFMRFYARASDPERIRAAAVDHTGGLAAAAGGEEQAARLEASIVKLVQTFVDEGIESVVAAAERVAPGEQEMAMQSYIGVIQSVLGEIYVEMLGEAGVDLEQGIGEADALFFDDALSAISLLSPYASPFYLRLTDFEHIQATGLEITRSPGKDIVYLGCVMLIAGVFFMFYMHHRRLWVRVVPVEGGGSRLLFAGAGHRERRELSEEFDRIAERLKLATGPRESIG